MEGDIEGETERVRQRTRGRVEEQEPARRLQLPPGPAGADTQEIATDETAMEEGGQSRTTTTRIGQVLAGIVRGVATRIAETCGAQSWPGRERGKQGRVRKAGRRGEEQATDERTVLCHPHLLTIHTLTLPITCQ